MPNSLSHPTIITYIDSESSYSYGGEYEDYIQPSETQVHTISIIGAMTMEAVRPLKCWSTSRLHGAVSQKAVLFIDDIDAIALRRIFAHTQWK
jgi:hypothetical protein